MVTTSGFMPISAALPVTVLSSQLVEASTTTTMFPNSEKHDNSSFATAESLHASMMHALNQSFVSNNATESSAIPWTTLAPAGFHGLHCEKGSLTNGFGVLIQFILGITAFSSLIVKRYFEPTLNRRPWIIWTFDTSKQAVGTIFTHFGNLAIASIPSGNSADPCFWYVFNYALDCTVGLLTMWTGLSLLDLFMKWLGHTDYRLGDHGKLERLRLWAIQCSLYCLVQIIEKLVVFGIVMIIVASISFEWLANMRINPLLETALALLVVPFVVNVTWFWIVDNLLMRQRRTQQDDSEDTAPANPEAFVGDDDENNDDDESPHDTSPTIVVSRGSRGSRGGTSTNTAGVGGGAANTSLVGTSRSSGLASSIASNTSSSGGRSFSPIKFLRRHRYLRAVRLFQPTATSTPTASAAATDVTAVEPQINVGGAGSLTRRYGEPGPGGDAIVRRRPSTSDIIIRHSSSHASVEVANALAVHAAGSNSSVSNNNNSNADAASSIPITTTTKYSRKHQHVSAELAKNDAYADVVVKNNAADDAENDDNDDDEEVMIISDSSPDIALINVNKAATTERKRTKHKKKTSANVSSRLRNSGSSSSRSRAAAESQQQQQHAVSNPSSPLPTLLQPLVAAAVVPLQAVRKHDNWRQQTPSTTSSSYPVNSSNNRQRLLNNFEDADGELDSEMMMTTSSSHSAASSSSTPVNNSNKNSGNNSGRQSSAAAESGVVGKVVAGNEFGSTEKLV